MYRSLPRTLSHLRGGGGGGGVRISAFPPARHYATKGAAPPPPLKLSFTERLRNRLWRPGALPPSQPESEAEAEASAPEAAVLKPTDTPGYVEAVDARDLPVVGLDHGPEEWDVPVFITNPRFHRPDAIHRAVHRATVELHTRLLNGLAASTFASLYTGPETLTPHVRIAVPPPARAASTFTFTFPTPAVEAAILAAGGAGGEVGVGVEEVRPYSEDEVYPLEDPHWARGHIGGGWKRLRLRDDDVRFALVKRVAQLTGIRVMDAEASRVNTIAELLEHLETKPKPLKLYGVIASSPLPALPNVKVFEKRVRPWDRERMIGRERPFEKAVEFRYPFEERGGK